MQSNPQAAKAVLDIQLGHDWQVMEDAIIRPLGFTVAELLDACFHPCECVFIGRSPSIITSTSTSANVALRVTDAATVLTSGVRLEAARSASLGGNTHRNWGALPIACKLIEALICQTPMTKLIKGIA